MIAKLLRDFAALFEVTGPKAPADRRAAWLFVLILAAGTAVRFWGLGAVGLHGDEKTMALPVMHLVEHGSALMPSGMFYPRAVGQLYLMAGSVLMFGQSEWALRLPSALCGVLLIALAWQGGRRFLTPAWNLAFTAAIAFLPDFIDEAQTARMYVFLATSVAAFMLLVFEWERTSRTGYLVGAVAVMLVGIHFHTLAIFAAFLLFIPGLLRADQPKLWRGAAAFAVILGGFFVINRWIGSQYFQAIGSANDDPALFNGPKAAVVPHVHGIWLALAVLVAICAAVWVIRRTGDRRKAAVAIALLATGVFSQLTYHYHLAALLILAGLVVANRNEHLSGRRAWVLMGVLAVAAVLQIGLLQSGSGIALRQILGLTLGWPSVWPFLAIAQYSAAAAVLLAAGVARGLWLVAHRKPVPDHLLMAVLGVWIPLLMIGFMRWDIPPRYAEAQVMPLLLGAFAAAQWLLSPEGLERGDRRAPAGFAGAATPMAHGAFGWGVAIAATVACVLVVNPVRLAHAVDSGYGVHPDHKGAAEYIESVHPGPHDVLVAEDVLQQTYYLGHVDYWLVNKNVAATFMHEVNGKRLELYTDTPVIGTGQELQKLVETADRGALYVIGSGENQEDGRRFMRGFGIYETLESPLFQVVYRGRDGVTKVWKAAPPRQVAGSGSR
jgi:4-amino-4-deoxy-L-arabinose transferase-like glycosyltransferase